MNKLFILLFLTCSISCSHAINRVDVAYAIEARFAYKAKQQFNVCPYGFGGSFSDKIRVIDVNFETNECNNIEEARYLIICLAKMLLEEINSDINIRPDLVHYPFQISDIVLLVIFNPGYMDNTRSVLAEVLLMNGEIEYCIIDHNKPQFVPIHTETFEEATQKLSVFN